MVLQILTKSSGIINQIVAQTTIGEGTDFELDLNLPDYGGVLNRGILAAIGFFLSLFLTLLLVIWVVSSMIGAYRIIMKNTEPQEIEKGIGVIKNVWISASTLILVFVALSFAGAIFGFGNVYDWSTNLAQCSPSSRLYYNEKDIYADKQVVFRDSAKAYCCNVVFVGGDGDVSVGDAKPPSQGDVPVGEYAKIPFREGRQWVLAYDGVKPDQGATSPYFKNCQLEFQKVK